MVQDWLHAAAIAAGLLTGQNYWQDQPAHSRRMKRHGLKYQDMRKADEEFALSLKAAD